MRLGQGEEGGHGLTVQLRGWCSCIFLQYARSLDRVGVGVRAADVMRGCYGIAACFLTDGPAVKVIRLHDK